MNYTGCLKKVYTLYNVCSVQRGMFSTSVGYHEYIGGYHEYIREYHEYIGGCSVHRGDIMMYVGEQVGKNLSISVENPDVLNIPRCTHDTPGVLMISPNVLMVFSRCTHDIPTCPPIYSWYPPRGYFHIRRSGGLAPKFASEILVGAPNFSSKNINDKYPKFCLLNFRYDPKIGTFPNFCVLW